MGMIDTPNSKRDLFGHTGEGHPVSRFTLVNGQGVQACLLDYGARLAGLWAPDRQGVLADVVLGFDELASYENLGHYFGCTIGRVANRIAGASFELDGRLFILEANQGSHHLHGGVAGFDKAVWQAWVRKTGEGPAVGFRHVSPDGDQGYPGSVEAEVIYTLTDENALIIDYRAECDAPTPLNLTNHSYWNLGGADVLGHELTLNAAHYLETDETLAPTGRILEVEDTAYDFRQPKKVGQDIAATGGYDNNYVLARARRPKPQIAAEVYEPVSGRCLTVSTTEPGVQFYSGNFLDGIIGKAGRVYGRHAALCLEAQMFPDALHHDHFPSIVLQPGDTYRQRTVYRFSLR